jgi:hypothetical protein
MDIGYPLARRSRNQTNSNFQCSKSEKFAFYKYSKVTTLLLDQYLLHNSHTLSFVSGSLILSPTESRVESG